MPTFLTVDDYLKQLEPWMRTKLEQVRQLFMTFPEISERVRYGVPFYDCNGMMMYMGNYQRSRLVIGFCNGCHMNDKSGILKNDQGQTQIRHYELYKDQPLKETQLIKLIEEAIRINITLHQRKYGNRNKKGKA